jgi:WbqC-like protein
LAKTVVITQSNYLPWRGYFELLRSADEVVLLDSVQYTRRDWRNRNRIKTSQGLQWLSIPVEVKGRYSQPIDETRIADTRWCRNHIRAIETAYRNAAHYQDVAPWLFRLLESVADEPLLARVNERTIRAICDRLAIATAIRRCTDLVAREQLAAMGATERLVAIANVVGADSYLTGPAARDYLDVDLFRAAGIEVQWMSYEAHAPYPQLWGGFEPRVSIVDLLLNTGREAIRYLDKAVK